MYSVVHENSIPEELVNKLTMNRRRDVSNLFISGNSLYNPSHS